MRQRCGLAVVCSMVLWLGASQGWAQGLRVLPAGEKPADARLGEPRTLEDYFPMQEVDSPAAWQRRVAEVRRRILVATGLWPMLPPVQIKPVIHGKVERDGYTVERVYFETLPGNYLTGSLYRPTGEAPQGGWPAILFAHGHGDRRGRLRSDSERDGQRLIAQGAEFFDSNARHHRQAMAAQFVRMGTVVFFYDMLGFADNLQFDHRPGVREHMNTMENFGFFSPQAELRLISMMGLQTWNSLRALDFLQSVEGVNPKRIGMTGSSGGGTQTFITCALDERLIAGGPVVMVSTAMQGGCSCENASHLRIRAGNVDFAALQAPRALGLVHADDWTREMPEKGMPELRRLYAMLGVPDKIDDAAYLQFGHNYNAVSRTFMYHFMNRHMNLGVEKPIVEAELDPLTPEESTVWTEEHPAPSGDRAGDAFERTLVAWWDKTQRKQIDALTPSNAQELVEYRRIIGGAMEVIVARTMADIGTVRFEKMRDIQRSTYRIEAGLVRHEQAEEQFPAAFVYPSERWNGEMAIHLHDHGKGALVSEDGSLADSVAQLVEAGFAVAVMDYLHQGEFTEDGEPVRSVPIVHHSTGRHPSHHAPAYHFGYNPSLYAYRVHDVMTMIALLHKSDGVKRVHLLGVGEQAGPIAAGAGALAGETLTRLAVDAQGFHFAQLNEVNHPMFTPGMLLYGDVPALIALNAPRPIWVAKSHDLPVAVYRAAGATPSLTVGDAGDSLNAAVRWLIATR